jgi:hypothetical protein
MTGVLPTGPLRSATPQTKTCLRGPRFGGHFVAGIPFLRLLGDSGPSRWSETMIFGWFRIPGGGVAL